MSSLRFLLSRRWLVLTVVAVALIPTMIELGFWQLHRHERRVANNELIAESLAADPVPVRKLTGPGAEVAKDRTWRRVTATGRYDTAHEVVVRRRTAADGTRIGYFVITPLVLEDGSALLVNRGWIAPGDDITVFPDVPAAPKGEVTVTGRLRPDETTATSGIKDRGGMPDRQIMLINSASLANDVPRPLLGGYVELTGTSPEQTSTQPERVPEPDHDSVGVHMAYAIQWWLFTAMVPVGWVVLARRERRELLAAREAPAAPSPTSSPEPTPTATPTATPTPPSETASAAAPPPAEAVARPAAHPTAHRE